VPALLAALLLLQGASFPKPAIDHIRADGDTVWFEGNRGYDTVRVRYCYVRRTGTWCRVPRARPAGRSQTHDRPRVPQSPRDSVAIAPGLTLTCWPYAPHGESCDAFALLTADDRREHRLVPHATLAARAALLKAIHLETEEAPAMSGSVTAHAVTNDAVWFGLGGGFPEGDGAFGGLLRFDRARRTVETITHPGLADATVTGLGVSAGAVWVGTAHPAEFGLWGSTGILRRDLRTGRWTRLDSATTPLPDNLVQALAVGGDVVCAATRDGLAIFDPTTGRWAVRFFRRAIVEDSIVYALAAARPSDEPGDEALFVAMEALGVRRRGAFAAAMRATGTQRLRTLLTGQSTLEDALTDQRLVPFLVEALSSQRSAGVAAGALARIGHRPAVRAIRAALERTTSVDAGIPLAAALARLGDAAGVSWLVRSVAADVWGGLAAHELVRLTGVSDAPIADPLQGEPARRAAQEFWEAWWRANRTSYRIVPREVGDEAYRAWLGRVREDRR
jgi:hypothetical protein